MPIWKRNLIVCWFGMFVTSIGMSQIAPILPLYIKHLGVDNTASIVQFSGIAFGITYIISAVFSPIWGTDAMTANVSWINCSDEPEYNLMAMPPNISYSSPCIYQWDTLYHSHPFSE
jgi:hypothetical protein